MVRIATFCLAALALSVEAPARVVIGNPEAGFRIEHDTADLLGGWVGVDSAEVTYCNGPVISYPVHLDVDPVAGFAIGIDEGDVCGIVWVWDMDLEAEGVGSLGEFSIVHLGLQTSVNVDPGDGTVALPVHVTAGIMPPGQVTFVSWAQ